MASSEIVRYGITRRWSDAVIHHGVAYFVEVADNPSLEAESQFLQVLKQVDSRLIQVGSNRRSMLQTTVYLPDPRDLDVFNAIWDVWVPEGHSPSRACIHAQLAAPSYRVELAITAAVIESV